METVEFVGEYYYLQGRGGHEKGGVTLLSPANLTRIIDAPIT